MSLVKTDVGTQWSTNSIAESADDEFDDDAALASPETWLGRRVNALVRTYRDVDDDGASSMESSGSDDNDGDNADVDQDETKEVKIVEPRLISDGYAIVTSKAQRRRLRFQRTCIIVFTWCFLGLNLCIIAIMLGNGISVAMTGNKDMTFGWRMSLLPLLMDFHYNKEKCMSAQAIEKLAQIPSSRNVPIETFCTRFIYDQFCEIEVGVPKLQIFYCVPSLSLYGIVAIIFLVRKKSRPYLKTLIAALSTLIMYLCIFYLIYVAVVYERSLRRLKRVMAEEMYVQSPKVITQWWDNTQTKGKCCGITGPRDWRGKFTNTSQSQINEYPLSCCDRSKSSSKCNGTTLPSLNEVFDHGCYDAEKQVIHWHTIITIVCLIIGAVTSPFMKFLFYFIGRISKKYIGQKSVNLRTPFMRCEAYGDLELVSFDLNPLSCQMIFFGKELRPGDIIKARVNRNRIFKLAVKRKRKRIAKIMVRSSRKMEMKPRKRTAPTVYKLASNLENGIILINF